MASGSAVPVAQSDRERLALDHIVVFHDIENVPLQEAHDGNAVFDAVLRAALQAVYGTELAASVDLASLPVRYYIPFCSTKETARPFFPREHVLRAFRVRGATVTDPGSKADAVDTFIKNEMQYHLSLLRERPDARAAAARQLFVLLSADSDFAGSVREARQLGVRVVFIHGGNSTSAYDSLISPTLVVTTWASIVRGTWREQVRFTFDQAQLSGNVITDTFARCVCLESVAVDPDTGVVNLAARTPAHLSSTASVRFSVDNWATFTDVPAVKDPTGCNAATWQHRVALRIPADARPCTLKVCARSLDGAESWDDNQARNYILVPAASQTATGPRPAAPGQHPAAPGPHRTAPGHPQTAPGHPQTATPRNGAASSISYNLYGIVKANGMIMTAQAAYIALCAAEPQAQAVVGPDASSLVSFVNRFPKFYDLTSLPSHIRIHFPPRKEDTPQPSAIPRAIPAPPPAQATATSTLPASDVQTFTPRLSVTTRNYIANAGQVLSAFKARIAEAALDGDPTVSCTGNKIAISAPPHVHVALNACVQDFVAGLTEEHLVLLGRELVDVKALLKDLPRFDIGYFVPREDSHILVEPYCGRIHASLTAAAITRALERKGVAIHHIEPHNDEPSSFLVSLDFKSKAATLAALEPLMGQELRVADDGASVVLKKKPFHLSFVYPKGDERVLARMRQLRSELFADSKLERAIPVPPDARLGVSSALRTLQNQVQAEVAVTLSMGEDPWINVAGTEQAVLEALPLVRAYLGRLQHRTVAMANPSKPLQSWLLTYLRAEMLPFQGAQSSATGREAGDAAEGDFSDNDSGGAVVMPKVLFSRWDDRVVISSLPEDSTEASMAAARVEALITTFKPVHLNLPDGRPTAADIRALLKNTHVKHEILSDDHGGTGRGRGQDRGRGLGRGRGAEGAGRGGAYAQAEGASGGHGHGLSTTAAAAPKRTLRIFGPLKEAKEAQRLVEDLVKGTREVTKSVLANNAASAAALRLRLTAPALQELAQQLVGNSGGASVRVTPPSEPFQARVVLLLTAPAPNVDAALRAAQQHIAELAAELDVATLHISAGEQRFLIRQAAILREAEAAGVAVLTADQLHAAASGGDLGDDGAAAAEGGGARDTNGDGALLRAQLTTGLKVTVRNSPFLRTGADAVVNAANERLENGGGIAAAIAKAGGKDFDQECLDSVRTHGPVPVGTARATDAGRMAARGIHHVIHAVAPRFSGDHLTRDLPLLEACILAALEEANRVGTIRLVLPCIGSGIFGWAADVVAAATVRVLVEFSEADDGTPFALQEVVLADVDASKAEAFRLAVEAAINAPAVGNTVAAAPLSVYDGTPETPTARPVPPPVPTHRWSWDSKTSYDPFVPYDYDQVVQLEEALASGAKILQLVGDREGRKSDSKHVPEGYSAPVYTVEFETMVQRNVKSGYPRAVKRVPLRPGDPMPPLYNQRVQEYEQNLAYWQRQQQSRVRLVRLETVAGSGHGTRPDPSAGLGQVTGAGNIPASGTDVVLCGPRPAVQLIKGKAEKAIADARKTWKLGIFLTRAQFELLGADVGVQAQLAKFNARLDLLVPDEVAVVHIGSSLPASVEAAVLRAFHSLPKGVQFPVTWRASDGGPFVPLPAGQTRPGELVEVPRGGAEFKLVTDVFARGGFACTVERVERVQNQELWEGFANQKQHMEKFSQPAGANECRMVHGTRATDPSTIVDSNFDFRFAQAGMFGRGAYFAETLVYSHNYRYRRAAADGEKCQVFVALVLAGRIERRTPDSTIVKPSPGHDSVQGRVATNHDAIMVYDLRQCYPEYLVTYRV